MSERFLRSVVVIAAVAGLAACERHTAPAARGAPEYFHGALSGDIDAQENLGHCYDKDGLCGGMSHDPSLACAWRGVRLASRSPRLALAENTAFESACAAEDPTTRQRAAIAFSDLSQRIWGRDLPDLNILAETLPKTPALYTSLETVRTDLNSELARSGRSERLPKFGPPRETGEGVPVAWTSCNGPICLDAATPSFGGGVLNYRVTVAAGAGAPQNLAARLAAAGLEAPSAVAVLVAATPRGVAKGPVCWSSGPTQNGETFAGASLAPCGITTGLAK